MRVLIVDDAVDLNNVIQKILINQNYEVDCAYDGKTGLRKALSNEYDIILLDIMMPQLNGYEVLKSLRKEGRETPIILITAKDDITDKIDGLDFGADDYLQKPFNMNELTARIRAVTRRNSKNDDKNEIYYSDICLNSSSSELSKEDFKISLELLAAPAIIGDSTMIPIRFISENMGMKVSWDGETKLITVNSK